jgi:hypothetical protein
MNTKDEEGHGVGTRDLLDRPEKRGTGGQMTTTTRYAHQRRSLHSRPNSRVGTDAKRKRNVLDIGNGRRQRKTGATAYPCRRKE